MLRAFLRRHRSGALTTAVAVVVGAVVAGAAIASGGYHTQRVALGDGTVWVPSAQYGAVGRANTGVLQLNTAVTASSDSLSVVQSGSQVFSVDETRATVSKVDVANATLGDPVTLPSGTPKVFFSGSTTVIGNADTGQVWSTPTKQLADFDASTKADLTLGADAVFDTDSAHAAVYSPSTRTASLLDVGESLTVAQKWSVPFSKKHDLQVAAVGTHVAVLDRTAGVIAVDGRKVALDGRITGKASLQQSSDTGNSFLVASGAGIARVSFSGGVSTQALAVQGTPARPYVEGSCVYAAWAGGMAFNSCNGAALQRLASVPDGATLSISHNGRTVVANDVDSGRSWAIDRSGQLIDNWSDLVQRDDQQQQDQTSNQNPEVETQQKPPVAVDDDLGARPGRTTVLPVLLNDYDPNGDPIIIGSVTSIDKNVGSLSVIDEQQQLQITLSASATGSVSFRYEISDGNGGTDSAVVHVAIHPESQNAAPVQARSTTANVVKGGHVTTNVLSDWVDPDGDPVYLASATASDGDHVSTTPDGQLTFTDSSGVTGKRAVQVTVGDGRAEGHGVVTVDVGDVGKVPLYADSFAVQGYAGKTISVAPLVHVRGGNGVVTLSSVPSVSRASIAPSYDAGTFTFSSTQVGDHQVEYTVTDGTKTASGVVRITVQAPPSASTAPITTPKTVFVQTLSTKDTDVTATDIDPAGGVLMVTGLGAVPARSGVQASVLDQHTVRVTLTAPLNGPVTFAYDETNGLASAVGSVTVIEIPKPSRVQPPVAQADSATVRVGDVATIDVLANDSQPDGEPISLDPDLVQNVPSGAGLLFVSGDTLRYLAPDTPGNFTAVYRVDGPGGQYADATVSIAVREKDAATNQPPVPETVTARVVAGESVKVQIPLDNIDPDGDSVQLVGVASNPDKGSVSDITANSLEYAAGDYSAGTDEFTYSVVDALGARATGTIRVGIAPRADQAQNPVAEPDQVAIRPGGSVTVRVLENDSDPDGGALTVTKAQPNQKGVKARIISGQAVKITPPATARSGDYAVLYTVENADGGASTAFVTVTVDRNAEPLRPEASDTTLDLQDILHRKTVTVDVLRNVFFAEGSNAALKVGLVKGYDRNAQVGADGRITVTIAKTSQIIPFSVARRDHPNIVSYAFIHVPGTEDALPQIDRSAPALTVRSEATIRIPLAEYVVTANGRTAQLTDDSTVKATHTNGGSLVVDRSTLQYTSAKLYYGNASISFEVTDGSNADGGKGRVATLVLPIKVTPRSNQPPSFTGTTIDMQPGDTRTFDLTKLTDYPYPKDLGELRYSVVGQQAGGPKATISGQRMTVKVPDDAKKDTASTIDVGVADASNAGRSGSVSIDVVASTRPLVQPASDQAITKRGTTTSVNVLANDQATNPFPGEPLRVLAIRGLAGGVPSGVSITPSADRSSLQVSVSGSAKPVDTHLQYEVADATGDPDRYVWGDVTISVEDVPSQPSAPTRTGSYQGGQISLTWPTPDANNAAITDYVVTGTGGVRKDCGTSNVCTITGLDPSASYSFQVTAANAIGRSKASTSSARLSADFVPDAPTGVTLQPDKNTPNVLDASWNAVPRPGRGSAVDAYVVTLDGPAGTTTRNIAAPSTSATFSGLTAAASYTVTVSARNDAARDGTAVQWNTSGAVSATAVGTPGKPTNVQAVTASTANDDGTSTVTVSWSGADASGGPSLTYNVYRSSSVNCAAPPSASLGSTSPVTDSGLGAGSQTYAVTVSNGYFCNVEYSSTTTYQRPSSTNPAKVSVVASSGGSYLVEVDQPAASANVDHYTIDYGSGPVALSGSWTGVPSSSYGRATSITVAACGSPGSQFCATDANSFHVTATAIQTAVTSVTATHGSAISVGAPANTGTDISVSYTAFWYCSLLGVEVPCASHPQDSWGSSDTPPTPPADANQVQVQATVTTTKDTTQVTKSGPVSTATDIAADPNATPSPEPSAEPSSDSSAGAPAN